MFREQNTEVLFGATPGSVQGLIQALCSEITFIGLGEPYGVLGILSQPRKAGTLLAILFCQPLTSELLEVSNFKVVVRRLCGLSVMKGLEDAAQW